MTDSLAFREKVKDSLDFIGGLGYPSKMPCQSYSISAKRCKTGAKIAKVPNSICSKCYAMRGNYRFSVVTIAHEKRYQSLRKSGWVKNMVTAINGTNTTSYFRWFDSGDLQGVWHLKKIISVCLQTPHIKHWLPTHEFIMVRNFLQNGGIIPSNLCVRLSAVMFEGLPPVALAKRLGVQTSGASASQFTCPSHFQDGKCLNCRKCWDKNEFAVIYKRH